MQHGLFRQDIREKRVTLMIEQVSVWSDLDIADPDFGPVLDKDKILSQRYVTFP